MGLVRGVMAIASLGIAVAGCSYPSWMPSWDLNFSSSAPAAATIQVESEPAGADAKSSVGPSCRTPCALSVATVSAFTVTFSLTGYEPQTISVTPRPPADPRENTGALKFDPDPVYAQLEPLPPAKGKKKGAPKAQKTTDVPPPPK
jgi:hypothetical protein